MRQVRDWGCLSDSLGGDRTAVLCVATDSAVRHQPASTKPEQPPAAQPLNPSLSATPAQVVPGRAQSAGAPGGAAQVQSAHFPAWLAVCYAERALPYHYWRLPRSRWFLFQHSSGWADALSRHAARTVSQTNAAPLPCRFFFQGAGDWADALVGQLGAHADSLLPLAAHQADAMLADAGRVSFTGAALLRMRAYVCRFRRKQPCLGNALRWGAGVLLASQPMAPDCPCRAHACMATQSDASLRLNPPAVNLTATMPAPFAGHKRGWRPVCHAPASAPAARQHLSHHCAGGCCC